MDDPKQLVSTLWLKDNLDTPHIRILDATWYLPGENKNAKDDFDNQHIPQARFFDIDDICDHQNDLPHMVPTVEKFISKVRALGVGKGHQIVVYDNKGLFSAARVWWLFQLMGHKHIAVLDGGLPKWIADGGEVTSHPSVIKDRHLIASPRFEMLKTLSDVAKASKLNDEEIIDARAAPRFQGHVKESRAGLRSGHIPGSKNVPFTSLLNADSTMKSVDELKIVFERAGVNLSKPAITTCGSGVTAAIISLALTRIGKTDHSLYDGSWAEWGQSPTLDIATGDA